DPTGTCAHGLRRPPPPDRAATRGDALHRAGPGTGAEEFEEVVARADPTVHTSAVVHEPPRRRPAQVRDRVVGARRRQADRHDSAVDAKETHNLLGPELVSRWSAYFPPAPAERLFHWLAEKDGQNKVLNIPISNVPGPREPGRVGGARVTEIYSVGPLTTGSGLNITVWSYVDQLNISVLSDGRTLADPHELTEALI